MIKPPQSESYWLFLCGTFDDGLRVINLDTNELVFHKIYEDEDLLAIDYIESMNKLVIGAGDGKLRLLDVGRIKEPTETSIKEDPKTVEDPAILLSDLDSDIRAVDVSND